MDVCRSELLRKHTPLETPRPPLVPAEKNNALTTRRPPTREVSSRYKSPSPSTSSGPRRCPSPNITRTVSKSSQLVQKRAHSTERKRPSTPPSPPRPSTPIRDSSADIHFSSRRPLLAGRLPESLWPSTMRSLSVSFQSDTISIPVISKKEKPVSTLSSDRTLRPTSNVGHKHSESSNAGHNKHGESHSISWKATPERKRSPLKGKIVPDHLENSKPVDGVHARFIDLHRWPSRTGGRVSADSLSRSVDLGGKTIRSSSTSHTGSGLSSLRRSASDAYSKSLQKSSSDSMRRNSLDGSVRTGFEANSLDDRISGTHKLVSTTLAESISSQTAAVRSQCLHTPGSRPPSPSRNSVPSSSVAKGIGASQSRPSTPPRGTSPSRIRPSTCQSNNPTSVLSFIADFKKGKKGANCIEDAHHLRLLYNGYLQWRFANARAENVLRIRKVTAERTLYNVWNATLDLQDSVTRKRISLQQLKLELKLRSLLDNQMAYLNQWSELEGYHIGSLSVAVEDLEASTVRIPVSGGARADIESLKGAICSAVDVMQAMGSSICSSLSRVEGMNGLVSELAVIAAQEKAVLHECEALLASTAAMQIEEHSLRTQLIQMKQALENELSILALRTPP